MAITTQDPVKFLPWQLEDTGKGTPTGIWTGSVTVVHDVSAGNAVGQIVFSFAAQQSGILWHLGEMFVVLSGVTTDKEAVLKSGSMGYGGNQFDLAVDLLLEGQAVTNEAHLRGADLRGLRNILLGQPLNTGDDAVLEVTTPNIDGDVLLLTAKGYYWDQSRIAQIGGPRLPDGHLWS